MDPNWAHPKKVCARFVFLSIWHLHHLSLKRHTGYGRPPLSASSLPMPTHINRPRLPRRHCRFDPSHLRPRHANWVGWKSQDVTEQSRGIHYWSLASRVWRKGVQSGGYDRALCLGLWRAAFRDVWRWYIQWRREQSWGGGWGMTPRIVGWESCMRRGWGSGWSRTGRCSCDDGSRPRQLWDWFYRGDRTW